MIRAISILTWLTCAALPCLAATPPAAQLLPADTLGLISVPDWDKAFRAWTESAYGKLWADPAMKPFRDKVIQGWKDDFEGPLEKRLGIRLADYADLLHGQVSLAYVQNGWGTQPDANPGVVFLLDVKDKQELLKTRLSELKRKWVDAGKVLKTDRIRDIEVSTLIVSSDDLAKAFDRKDAADKPDDDAGDAPSKAKKLEKTEISFGQSGSLLLVSNNAGQIERILARLAGGLAPALAEQGLYETSQGALFRDALGFGWLNFTRIYEVIEKQIKDSAKTAKAGNPLAPRADKVLAASGLSGLKTLGARIASNGDGTSAEVFLNVPAAQRQGLFRLLEIAPKDATPPPFVGADVLKFSRWRVDGQKSWATIETMLTAISPELSGILQMGLQAAGKDADPNFDLKKALIGNLGDDFMSMEKTPAPAGPDKEPVSRSLVLIGSANADQLVQGVKAATGLMPLAGGESNLSEREFLGRKIYSLSLASGPGADEPGGGGAGPAARSLSFASGSGYAALSSDPATLEEYLRTSELRGKPLRDMAGLSEAGQKVGGMNAGSFGYENQALSMRLWLESAKHESAALDKLLALAPIGGKGTGGEEHRNVKTWFDASLMPPFDKISNYFHFFVYSLSSSDAGLSWKAFAPTPPKLKQ